MFFKNQKGFIPIIALIIGITIGGVFSLTKYYGYQRYGIGNPNMTPKIAPGQEWVFRSKNKSFERGDVIAFKIPQNPKYSNLARIIGLPGETIAIKDGKVYINKKPLNEIYIPSEMKTTDGQAIPEGENKTITSGSYAVLADNRIKGIDSRDYGFIQKNNILGKLVFCFKNCSKSDDSITASYDPQLHSNEILNLVNQYRQSKKLPTWTTSEEICNLAEKRADFLSENNGIALTSSTEEYQKQLDEQAKNYSGASLNELYISNVGTNQEAISSWKGSPDNNKFLLMTESNGASITLACAAVRVERSLSLVVLLSGPSAQGSNSVVSQKTNQSQTQSPSQPAGPGYIKEDIDNLIRDLNQADQDYKTMEQSYKGVSTYNQQTINRILQIIPQRKSLAQKLLDKMGKGQSLTQADFATWDQYSALTAEQNDLVKTLYNGNGGF